MKRKKIVASVLSAVMVVSLLSVFSSAMVFADEEDGIIEALM